MKKNLTKEDRLLSGIMKDLEMTTPPEDFTARVMERVEMESVAPDFISRPLISKAGWVVIGIGVIILMLVILLSANGESSSPDWISQNLNWNFRLPQIDFSRWRIIDFSNPTLIWIMLGTGGIMLFALIEKWIEDNKFRKTFLH